MLEAPIRPRFLLDVNVGRSVKQFLEEGGFDVTWTTEINPHMQDDAILALANEQERILITVDKDFGDLIFHQGLPTKGVIRLEDARPTVQIRYLRTLLDRHLDELENHFTVVEGGRIRVRDI